MCSELKSNIDAINTKVETIMSNTKKGLVEALPVNIDDDSNSDFELVNLSGLESELEGQLIKLFRRLALPFKKANRRQKLVLLYPQSVTFAIVSRCFENKKLLSNKNAIC